MYKIFPNIPIFINRRQINFHQNQKLDSSNSHTAQKQSLHLTIEIIKTFYYKKEYLNKNNLIKELIHLFGYFQKLKIFYLYFFFEYLFFRNMILQNYYLFIYSHIVYLICQYIFMKVNYNNILFRIKYFLFCQSLPQNKIRLFKNSLIEKITSK